MGIRTLLVVGLPLTLLANAGLAFTFNWTGDGGNSDWFTPFNWITGEIGIGPPAQDDDAIIENGDSVSVSRNFLVNDLIASLIVRNGSTLTNASTLEATTGYEVIVNDSGGTALTTVTGANSELVVRRHVDGSGREGFDTDQLLIGSGGTVTLVNGRIEIDGTNGQLDVQAGGGLSGYGWIDFAGTYSQAVTALENDGEISVASTTSTRRTLRLDFSAPEAEFDMDGTSGGGVVALGTNGALVSNGVLADTFSGELRLGTGALLDFEQDWIADSRAEVNVDASGSLQSAEVAGGDWLFLGSLNLTGGTLLLAGDGRFGSSAAISVAGSGQPATLRVDGTWAVTTGSTFNMTGGTGEEANLIVNGELTFDDPVNLDSSGANRVDIGAGGFLRLPAITDSFSSNLTLGVGSTLRIDGSWTADSRSEIHVDAGFSSGTATIGGGPWNLDGELFIDAGELRIDNSVTSFRSSSVVDVADGALLSVAGSSTLEGRMNLRGSAEFNAASLVNEGVLEGVGVIVPAMVNGGTIDPGSESETGTLEFHDDLLANTMSSIEIDLDAAGATHDLIDVAGTLTLDGALVVSFLPEASRGVYEPNVGDTFRIARAQRIEGQFADMFLPPLVPGFGWQFVQTPTFVELQIALSADFNQDGTVDGRDFLIWQQHFGTSESALPSNGDADGDGDVDGEDFLAFQLTFGQRRPKPSTRAIPEPGTQCAMLLALGAISFASGRIHALSCR